MVPAMLIDEKSPNLLFKQCSVPTISQTVVQLKKNIMQHDSELKYLVAEKYRDLINISNEIAKLNDNSFYLDHSIATICFKENKYRIKTCYKSITRIAVKHNGIRTRNLLLKNWLNRLEYMLLTSDNAGNLLDFCETYYIIRSSYGPELDSCKALNTQLKQVFDSLDTLLLERIVKKNSNIKELEAGLVSVIILNRFKDYPSLMRWFFHQRFNYLKTIFDIKHKLEYINCTIQICNMVRDQTLNYKLYSSLAAINEQHEGLTDAKFFDTEMGGMDTLYNIWLQDVSKDVLKSYIKQSSKLTIPDLFSFFKNILSLFEESALLVEFLLIEHNSLLLQISELFFDDYLKLVIRNINHVDLSLSDSSQKVFGPFSDATLESLAKMPVIEPPENRLVSNYLQLVSIYENEINPLNNLKAFVQKSKELEICNLRTLLLGRILHCQNVISELLDKVQYSLLESLNRLPPDQSINNIFALVSLSSLPGLNAVTSSPTDYSTLISRWLWSYLLHQLEILKPRLLALNEGDLDSFIDIFYEYCCLLMPNVIFHEVYRHPCFANLRELVVIKIAEIISSKGCYYLERHFLSNFLLTSSLKRGKLRENCQEKDAKLSNRVYRQNRFLFVPLLLIPDP
ncbi:BA75_04405T0 [Komagataella pastoris]|uniref:BA75_04405T0 n=1 Tax=Komagataella pastoris TaxID=4922 RepID=A0A1B2JHG7_PICPA|nr:BA75_04405T0 [Komagataella pastoris]